MWHKQSFTQFWSQSDAYSRRSSLKLTYIHHPLVVCTHQICCAVAVPIALSQDRLLHGHNRLVNWTPCSRMRESKLKMKSAQVHGKVRWKYTPQILLCWESLAPIRRQAIVWTNAGILLIGPWGTNFNEILIKIQQFSLKKMHLKMSSGKWWPFCVGPNVSKHDQTALSSLWFVTLMKVISHFIGQHIILLPRDDQDLYGIISDFSTNFTNTIYH